LVRGSGNRTLIWEFCFGLRFTRGVEGAQWGLVCELGEKGGKGVRGGGGGYFVKGGKQINLKWADDVGLALTEV